eukprot:jgi/Mesvir1/6835/Mv09015-RA.2
MNIWDGSDRFNLLHLQEGEYYFKDFTYELYNDPSTSHHRSAGILKVCSASLIFVPRKQEEPMFRVPLQHVTDIQRCTPSEVLPSASGRARDGPGAQDGAVDMVTDQEELGHDIVVMRATQDVILKTDHRNIPYRTRQGHFVYHFLLVYSPLDNVLPLIMKLHALSREVDKAHVTERALALATIIKEHEDSLHFNPGWMVDEKEQALVELVADRVTPLVAHPGRVVITCLRIYFQPFNVVSLAPVLFYELSNVESIMDRRYNLKEVGLEVFFRDRTSAYFAFKNEKMRGVFHQTLVMQPGFIPERVKPLSEWTHAWINNEISNFDYLMYLNREAGRSFNDLTQYPVFPWVLTDYTSKELNLSDPDIYRDLSKPIGALNPSRLASYQLKYEELRAMMEEDAAMREAGGGDGANTLRCPPPYLYGCHYSSPGSVVYFMLRQRPELMLRLQNGKFDMPDRLLHSFKETWESVYNNPADVKELIPECYDMSTDYLLNTQDLDFGMRQTGEPVDHLKLPPWAKDAQDFASKMRGALESPIVSRKLHKWVDLMFGYKQQGAAAEKALNTFYPLTYDDWAMQELQRLKDQPELCKAVMVQMNEFGRVPKQLFTQPHGQRKRRRRTGSRLVKLLGCQRGFSRASREPDAAMASPHMPSDAEPQSPAFYPATATGHKRRLTPEKGDFAPSKMPSTGRGVIEAIRRVCNSDDAERNRGLDMLKTLACEGGDDELALYGGSDLQSLPDMLRAASSADRLAALSAMRVLASSPSNRPLLLHTRVWAPSLDALCSYMDFQCSVAAAEVISLLCCERHPHTEAMNGNALGALCDLLLETSSEDLRAAAMTGIRHVCSFSATNRSTLQRIHRMRHIVAMLQPRYPPQVRMEACRALDALCTDDSIKVLLLELGGLQPILDICRYRGLPYSLVRVTSGANESGDLARSPSAPTSWLDEVERAGGNELVTAATVTPHTTRISVQGALAAPDAFAAGHGPHATAPTSATREPYSRLSQDGNEASIRGLNLAQDAAPLLWLAALRCIGTLAQNERLRIEVAARGGVGTLCAAAAASLDEMAAEQRKGTNKKPQGEDQGGAVDAVGKPPAWIGLHVVTRPDQVQHQGPIRQQLMERVHRTAGRVLATLCRSPLVVNVVVREEGLVSVLAMARSDQPDVQRQAASAFWHLAVHHDDKKLLLKLPEGMRCLLALARLEDENPKASLLAKDALQKLAAADTDIRTTLQREEDGDLLLSCSVHLHGTAQGSATSSGSSFCVDSSY